MADADIERVADAAAEPLPIKALTVRQPWAWAIAAGYKTIENRGWSTPYRGPLAIHAAQLWDDDDTEGGMSASRFVRDTVRAQGGEMPPTWRAAEPLSDVGVIVAVAQLTGICSPRDASCGCGPWATYGSYHWHLTDVRALAEPIPAKGRLGLWPVALPEEAS